VLATIGISQTFAANAIQPRTKYAVGVRLKTASVTQGTIKLRLAGTGYTPGATEKIELAADWPTDWTLETFFVNLPAAIPSDLELVVEVTGTLDNGATILIDDVALVPCTLHGGVSFAAFAGASPFVVGDFFTVVVSNDEAGVFQTLFGRLFDIQLPSATGAAETIDDALCA